MTKQQHYGSFQPRLRPTCLRGKWATALPTSPAASPSREHGSLLQRPFRAEMGVPRGPGGAGHQGRSLRELAAGLREKGSRGSSQRGAAHTRKLGGLCCCHAMSAAPGTGTTRDNSLPLNI